MYSQITLQTKSTQDPQPLELPDSAFPATMDPVLYVLWMWKLVSAQLWQAFSWPTGEHCTLSHISMLLSESQSVTKNRT